MNNDLREALDTIKTTDEQRSRMLSGIKATIAFNARRRTKWLRVAAVAAVLCCLFGVTAFAEEITGFAAGIFADDAVVGDTVRTCVYSDSDGHVNMTVEELLSDMSTVRMVVHYRALDEVGESWIASLSYCGKSPDYYRYSLFMGPDFKENNTDVYGVSWSHDTYELEEYRTDTERRFVVYMEADGDDWGTRLVRLFYGMTDGCREKLLDVTTDIEKHTFSLDASEAPDKLYKPTKVEISPLSFRIYGKNCGLFEITRYGEGENAHHVVNEIRNEQIDSLKIIFEDGTKLIVFRDGQVEIGGIGYFCSMSAQHDVDDIVIVTMSFDDPIDPGTVAGIELDGVYYPFSDI